VDRIHWAHEDAQWLTHVNIIPKRRQDLDHPSDYQFLKDDYRSRNYLVRSPIYV
jgi:hypothetical protein